MTANKPWAILKVSRKQYATARPWKNAGMSREQFEQIPLEADAERLIAAAFGGGDEPDG